MPKSPKRNKAPAPSTLRIIGGRHRGRKLPIPALDGLRPTSDRIRETLFNWVQFDLPGMRVLDLFAGTGALGLEALSRDAGSAVFVEPQAPAANGILQSLQTLTMTGDVQRMTAEQFLSQQATAFDLIFVDPPFALNLWDETLSRLAEDGWLARGGYIYVETPVGQLLQLPAGLSVTREKCIGAVCFRLLQMAPSGGLTAGH